MSSETLNAIETTTQVAVENKPKKRGRKPGKNRKGYFYEEEEAAFVKYITSTDQAERNKLFNEKLLPAFTKMIESIIRRYDLFTPSEDFTDTFYDTLSFLITKVNNFDVTKGYKVYSYCGTVCKNYLILKRTTYMKQRDRFYPYDEVFLEPAQRNDDDKKLFNWNLNEELIDGMKNEIDGILNKKVLLIDLDPQGNATTGVGVERGDIKNSIYEVMVERVDIKDAIVKTKSKILSY